MTTLDDLLVAAMKRQNEPEHEIARFRLILSNFISGRIDPVPDERAIKVQTWAMLMAREAGASGPREALDMIRDFPSSDEGWEASRSAWEFFWSGLPAQ